LLVAAGTRYRSKKITRFRGMNGRKWRSRVLGSACIEPFAELRDITELGHCDFQFYGNAAGYHFSPAALLVCRQRYPGSTKCRAFRRERRLPPQNDL
jgi:hypothetical protein